MSEFVFNRPTLIAIALLTVLLGLLTFSAGALTGVTWVERMTPLERQAWRGEAPEPEPARGVEAGAWSGTREVAVSPDVRRSSPPPSSPSSGAAGAKAPAAVAAAQGLSVGAMSPVTPAPPVESAQPFEEDLDRLATRPEPATTETDVAAPRPSGWVRLGPLDWRRADEMWASRRLALHPAAGELFFLASHPVPPTPYGELIYETSRRHAINPLLVAAVIRVESNFDPRAVSRRGARGLMQLMPETASRFGIEAEALEEPRQNLEAGVSYLRWLGDRFAGDLPLVLSGYNAGPEAVERYRGIPPFRETRNYVDSVLGHLGVDPPAR